MRHVSITTELTTHIWNYGKKYGNAILIDLEQDETKNELLLIHNY
jgi:hypothetical protein